MMKPLTKSGGGSSPSRAVQVTGGPIVREDDLCDLENQLGQQVLTRHQCHGASHSQLEGDELSNSGVVEYQCDVCQYFLCDDCYTTELKRLNNIPTRKKSTDTVSDGIESFTSSKSPHDLEMGYGGLPTESVDTIDSIGGGDGEGRSGRQIETMSVQVEVDNFSTKSVTESGSVHNAEFIEDKPSMDHTLHQLSSEDALSEPDLLSSVNSQPFIHPFRLFPSHLVALSPRKMSVGGLTYSSLDSDSIKDDDSMRHFRVDGRIPIHESHHHPPLEDDNDDNMTNISTIRSESNVSSILLPLRRGADNNNLSRRRFSLRSHEDSQSVGGGGGQNSTTSPGPQSYDDGENEDDDECHSTQIGDEELGRDDVGVDGGGEGRLKQEAIVRNNLDPKCGDGDEQIEESVSDGGLDNEDEENMSIGSIDSTKCYPNNLYHSKGFLTIASLHKTDSPSGYLTHHLSTIPASTALRFNHNTRRNKLPSPSQSHTNSPHLIEENLGPPPLSLEAQSQSERSGEEVLQMGE
jgi:hypothetical protein